MINDKVVYAHYKKTDEICTLFYIGYGNAGRPYDVVRRHDDWKEIINEHEHKVVILHKNISIELAKELEKKYIRLYGRFDKGMGSLVNKTNGGDGFDGVLVKGSKNGRYDHTIYKFQHDDGTYIECTRYELTNDYGLISSNVGFLVKGKYQRCKGWKCLNPLNQPKYIYNKDEKIYDFVFEDGTKETCNKNHLVRKYQLHSGKLGLVISGKRKSHKGWRIG